MGVSALWEVWEVKFLLLSSLVVQVLLLIVSEWRRCASWAALSMALNGTLWILYLIADNLAIYVLGHMSLSSKPHEQQQLMAFWASLLLVHLGGQDTITAYAMEDNNLWLRHLFILMVQAAGAAFVLYKYVNGGSRALLAAAVLMFLVGFVKYLERIYALYCSGLDNIRKFLDGVDLPQRDRIREYLEHSEDTQTTTQANLYDEEEVLQGAHDLLQICMGQLVDYKVWPTQFQNGAILAYHDRTRSRANPDGTRTRSSTTTTGRSMLLQLVGMQLSLMRDILYTKTVLIHTWYGFMSRIVSTVSTAAAFCLFHQFTMGGSGGGGYSRGDTVVTYVLLAGALFLEVASVLRAVASTWTCASLRAAGWKRLHAALVYFRRRVKAAQICRKWSGSIRQHDLLQLYNINRSSACYSMASCLGLKHQWNRLCIFDSIVISDDVEDLLLREIKRMVEACGENEDTLWGYRGQLALGAWGAGFYDDGEGVEDLSFGGSILAWHYATDAFLHFFHLCSRNRSNMYVNLQGKKVLDRVPKMAEWVDGTGSEDKERLLRLTGAIHTLSRYMMFLLAEQPHMLPSPVRRSQYDNFCREFQEFPDVMEEGGGSAILPAVHLANKLLDRCEKEGEAVADVLRVISGVWVEMLCYASNHCSNDVHAMQLSSGSEFITLVWILTTALFNHFYCDNHSFRGKASRFQGRHDWRKSPLYKRIRAVGSDMHRFVLAYRCARRVARWRCC